jgi:hypothetical protein
MEERRRAEHRSNVSHQKPEMHRQRTWIAGWAKANEFGSEFWEALVMILKSGSLSG